MLRSQADDSVPPLENGAHLSAREFLRRFEAMPELKKAELINGIVYMGTAVRYDQHGKQDALTETMLGVYALATPGVEHATNSTARLGPDDVPQPDALLRIVPECGGQSRLDAKGYLLGAPELVVEIAASSVSIDLHEKFSSYRRARVREYLVWRAKDRQFSGWMLDEDEYLPLEPDANGILRSRAFPGLWLDVPALLNGDGAKAVATLQNGLASPEHQAFSAALAKAREPI